jgi:hypothetical protein
VIGVAVCNQDRIQTFQTETQSLLSEVGGRVDKYGAVVVFDDD